MKLCPYIWGLCFFNFRKERFLKGKGKGFREEELEGITYFLKVLLDNLRGEGKFLVGRIGVELSFRGVFLTSQLLTQGDWDINGG